MASRFDTYLSITRKQYIARAIERWARWAFDNETTGQFVPAALGYGKGNHMRLTGGAPSTRVPTGPANAEIEMQIERALWRYQHLDGRSERGRQVTAFRLKHLTRMTQLDAADEIKVSVATYKRYVANVTAYLHTEVFDDIR